MTALLREVDVTRYVAPLREGGSLPGLVEASDQFLYVIKFRGAGQGKNALIAELIGGELARELGFRVPEIVFARLDSAFGRMEGDEEVQDLLKASSGLNLGLHFLSGAITFDPTAVSVDPLLASRLVWLDALLMNVDRTVRNTNLLWWHKELWLIDHGAALYFHHTWTDWKQPEKVFPGIKNHVLLPHASLLDEADSQLKPRVTEAVIHRIVDLLPDEWLDSREFSSPFAQREAYKVFLNRRVSNSFFFVNEAKHARDAAF